ncbi:MAG: redoxin domain-containing protein [bacterium]|nr:redoxin domain-containing protein [bacterium]
MQNNSHDKSSSKIIGAVIVVLVLIGISVYATRGKDNGNINAVSKTEGVASDKQIAPDFSLDKLGGGTITLAEYRGQKPVVLDFWTTWCPNCRRSMPNLNNIYEKYKDQIEVIGIDMQEDPSLVQKFISGLGITFPIALDSNGSVTRAYGVRYTNVHVLIDKDGNVVRLIPGDISEADILELIK